MFALKLLLLLQNYCLTHQMNIRHLEKVFAMTEGKSNTKYSWKLHTYKNLFCTLTAKLHNLIVDSTLLTILEEAGLEINSHFSVQHFVDP